MALPLLLGEAGAGLAATTGAGAGVAELLLKVICAGKLKGSTGTVTGVIVKAIAGVIFWFVAGVIAEVVTRVVAGVIARATAGTHANSSVHLWVKVLDSGIAVGDVHELPCIRCGDVSILLRSGDPPAVRGVTM